ncbi:Putative protein in type-1 retrotransposable element R1DM [Araneus ventricosus]|uniref:Uncharacterized protein n=1 Tax=Araneus ventricosus TaxID=182803 RepID=A0A4Y2AU84_ARAVE|nr:Putative protein in type-1 retrotransposable element R1DM [Araneus ventricosus]
MSRTWTWFCAGTILWFLIANEALNKFGVDTEVKVQAFADNFVAIIGSTASYHFSQIGTSALAKLEKWAEDFSLSFSHEKSRFTMFKHRKNITHISKIKLLSKRTQYTKELKYLGLTFDPNFSWMPHLHKFKEKITKLQQTIYRIARATWGLKPEVIKEIYLRVIERIIFYGKEIWYKENVAVREKLFQIQRTGLLAIAKTYKTVSTLALNLLTVFSPFDNKSKKRTKFGNNSKILKI